ncbi:phosphatidylinositol alpha-1,6-mannosyltransferase [Rhodoblastus acidophilus]|uniref:glycosyltransferase family 4 protein n=1 Tax=Rhodoblastus acidophilus TaxID=1074 RepID=UPI0022249ED6|nr:glycosyltransferase family 4 protein [Rhodoblastus acidophilus]MCW2284302.1 phosphatidylinositol alpha-1,6-mannosyltransferase [Rhodoblastus acidophilus]MCW2333220.1 phosphatidylinositol alpha-1,6-mannosyltransferase [Rhodoblastus acidophilus]
MKVLALVPEAFGGHGGIAQYNRDLITALARSGGVESVRILPRLAAGPVGELPAKVTQADPIFARSRYVLNVFAEALWRRPDLIFSGHLYTAPLARHLAKLIGAPYVVQLHGTEVWREPSPAQRTALEKADAVLCVSRHTRAQTVKFTRAAQNRVIVVPNTVGADYRPGDREAARRKWGLRDEFVLLSVGRLDSREGYKGHDQVIDAIPELADQNRKIVYYISGDGDDRTRLETLAERRGVSDRVLFLGFTPRNELPDLYRAADVFVMPSRGEGFGIVFLEAMASGTPALGYAIGGATDPLDFGDWGRAIAADQLLAALDDMIAMPRPDSEKMFQAVRKRFGFDVFAQQVEDQLVRRFAAAA